MEGIAPTLVAASVGGEEEAVEPAQVQAVGTLVHSNWIDAAGAMAEWEAPPDVAVPTPLPAGPSGDL